MRRLSLGLNFTIDQTNHPELRRVATGDNSPAFGGRVTQQADPESITHPAHLRKSVKGAQQGE